MKTYVTGYRPPHLELVLIRLGSCVERWAFGRLLFLPGVGLFGSGAWASSELQAPLDCFRVLPFCGLKVWKDRAKGPGKGN